MTNRQFTEMELKMTFKQRLKTAQDMENKTEMFSPFRLTMTKF